LLVLRTSALGYDAANGVRQKFTSKERDNETGLDDLGGGSWAMPLFALRLFAGGTPALPALR
jgi:hypothetical protein